MHYILLRCARYQQHLALFSRTLYGFLHGVLKWSFMVMMNCFNCFRHLTSDYHEHGCGFFILWIYSQLLCFILLLAIVLKPLYAYWFPRIAIQFLCYLMGLKRGFWSKYVLDEDIGIENAEDENLDGYVKDEEDGECDVSILRKLIKMERSRADSAIAELDKERSASATAIEEAMAMIVRLQNEKSSIEIESMQYRRLAEEKQAHDQEVIETLEWLVLRHEHVRALLEEEIGSSRRKLNRVSRSCRGEELGLSLLPASCGYNVKGHRVLEDIMCSPIRFSYSP